MDKEFGFSIKVLGTDEQVSQLGKVESALKSLANDRAALNKAVKDGTVTEEEYGQQIADINLKTQSLRGSKRELERSIEVENELLAEQGGSYNQLATELNNLRQQYRNLSEEERQSAEGDELLQKIGTLDTELKDIDASMGQYQRNVGNYSSAFNALGGQLTSLSPALGQAQAQFNQINNVLIVVRDSLFGQTAAQEASNVAVQSGVVSQTSLAGATQLTTTATNSQTKSLVLLRAALMATGIGAFVVLIGSLITALLSTQQGMDAVNSVLRPLTAIFQRLFGLIQNFGLGVFDRLKQAINDPKQAFIDLGDAIKENVMNRLEAFGIAGKAIVKILKGDMAEGFKDLGDAFIQVGTGIENGTDKISQFVQDSKEFVEESVKAGSKLHDLQVQIEKDENKLIVTREKLNAIYQEQRLLAQDQNATDQERIAALNKAQAAQEELLRAEQALIDKKIEKKELENSLNDTSRADEKELMQLIAERERADAQASRRTSTLVSLRSGIIKRQRAEEQRIIEANNKKILEEAQKLVDAEIEAIDTGLEEKLNLIDTSNKMQLLKVRERLANEVISEEEAQKEVIAIQEDSIQKQLNAVQNQNIELIALREKLAEELAEVSELEQTGQSAARKEAILKELGEIDKRNEQIVIKTQELQTELAETVKARKEEGTDWLTELFGISGDQAESIKAELSNLAMSLYKGFFDLKEQQLEKNLNRELKMIEAQQAKALAATDDRYKREKRLLQQKLDSGEISQEDYNSRLADLDSKLNNERGRINEKYADKEETLRQEAFEREKDLSIARAKMDAALAVIKAYATMDPISASIFAAAIGVTAGIQIAKIQAQEYALGGLLEGPSHSNGGIPIVAEGGEAIINKRSMASGDVLSLTGTPYEIASAINAYRGYGKAFALGGQVPYPSAPVSFSRSSNAYQGLTAVEMDEIATRIINGINNKRVILVKDDQDDFEEEVSIVNQVKTW